MLQIIAHRGARSMAPENTLLAAKTAKLIGADLWETDVTLTRDQHLVLFHDKTLLRCTDAALKFKNHPSWFISDFNLQQLLTLDAGSHFLDNDPFSLIAQNQVPQTILSQCSRAQIPTLEQGLELTQEYDWQINLELKDHGFVSQKTLLPDLTLEAIKKSSLDLDQVRISSFNHEWLRRIQNRHPEIKIEALIGQTGEKALDFGTFEFDTYNINADLADAATIKLLKNKNKAVNLFTVNDTETFDYFENAGADGIFTDFPQNFKSVHP